MTSNACLTLPPFCNYFEATFCPIKQWTKGKIVCIKKILDKHTDVIHNLGILAITTCLLASKIFEKTPKFLPRLAKVVFDYGGIIWLNIQIRDFFKTGRDLIRAYGTRKLTAVVETAAKVFVAGVNILLTCAYFAGSVASAFIFPQASLLIALAVRSFALSCLFINVGSVVRDYFVNQSLLHRLDKLEENPERGIVIGKVMVCFLEIIKNVKTPSAVTAQWKQEWDLADSLVRQLDNYALEPFKESLEKEREEKNPFVDALKLFYGLKEGMRKRQAYTEAELCLIAIGYAAMGVCRAYPDSLIEMMARWSTSVLHTDKFIQAKFFQSDLSDSIDLSETIKLEPAKQH